MAQVRNKWARVSGRVLSPSGAPIPARLSIQPTSSPSMVRLDDGTVVVSGNAYVRADDAGGIAVDVVVGESLPVELTLSTPGDLIARRTVILESGKEYEIHDLISGRTGNVTPNPPGNGGGGNAAPNVTVNPEGTIATLSGYSGSEKVILIGG